MEFKKTKTIRINGKNITWVGITEMHYRVYFLGMIPFFRYYDLSHHLPQSGINLLQQFKDKNMILTLIVRNNKIYGVDNHMSKYLKKKYNGKYIIEPDYIHHVLLDYMPFYGDRLD